MCSVMHGLTEMMQRAFFESLILITIWRGRCIYICVCAIYVCVCVLSQVYICIWVYVCVCMCVYFKLKRISLAFVPMYLHGLVWTYGGGEKANIIVLDLLDRLNKPPWIKILSRRMCKVFAQIKKYDYPCIFLPDQTYLVIAIASELLKVPEDMFLIVDPWQMTMLPITRKHILKIF